MPKKNKIHIGYLIKGKMEKDRKSKQWLADNIDCCRTNVYRIIDRPSIDTELLHRISLALRKNFFDDLADHCQNKIDKMEESEP